MNVEYVEILVLLTLGMSAATVAVGFVLLRYYDVLDGLIGLPFP